ncbi:hypothetical protein ACVILI_006745 [Mesorhizobium sp. USDA 4775]|uniref:Uncharacterized protein n=1 Tax=Mesorhizobium qingshengii TaxID=1165689 RepID=A0A1G5ZZ44_9HYPH|nr:MULTISPECIES: hypothetical protein [Mesorhizobium]MCH4561378.1 hypothetical protein [Mesorhizobium jarvisii]SDA99972.1 hypothetical protein SAMN02927914_06806 [Mesorhizobium qingshengii]
MNTIPTSGHLVVVRDSFARKLLELARRALVCDQVIPYLGPGLLRLALSQTFR